MVRLNWTAEAELWLREIHSYIASDNPEAANGVIRGILKRAELLREYPEVGYRYEHAQRDVRILLYGHYRIAYLVRDATSIDILGVFHGALDIERYLP